MADAGRTIFALVEVDIARCPHGLDFLLRVAQALLLLARAAVWVWAWRATHCKVALAGLERDQWLDRHGGWWWWCWWDGGLSRRSELVVVSCLAD
jgi:hypothetical protein